MPTAVVWSRWSNSPVPTIPTHRRSGRPLEVRSNGYEEAVRRDPGCRPCPVADPTDEVDLRLGTAGEGQAAPGAIRSPSTYRPPGRGLLPTTKTTGKTVSRPPKRTARRQLCVHSIRCGPNPEPSFPTPSATPKHVADEFKRGNRPVVLNLQSRRTGIGPADSSTSPAAFATPWTGRWRRSRSQVFLLTARRSVHVSVSDRSRLPLGRDRGAEPTTLGDLAMRY